MIQTSFLAFAALALVGCLDTDQKKIYGEGFDNPTSIVSLSPSSSEVLGKWGPFEHLKGRTASCNWPSFIGSIPVVLDQTKPNFEKIAALKADLVVYDPQLFNADDIAKIEQLGAKTLAWDPMTVDELIEDVHKMGASTRSEIKSSEYADLVYVAKRRALAEAQDPSPTVVLVIPGTGGEPMIAGANSFQADVIRSAGGKPLGPDSDRFVTLNAEALVAQNPDVIIVTGKKSAILGDPRFASISAVKNGRVEEITADAALRRGGRVDLFITAMSGMIRSK